VKLGQLIDVIVADFESREHISASQHKRHVIGGGEGNATGERLCAYSHLNVMGRDIHQAAANALHDSKIAISRFDAEVGC
jgi:hypothetical protein